MRFPLSFGRTKALLVLLGMGPARSWVDVENGETRIEMGWSFKTTFATTAIANVEHLGDRRFGSIGVHGWAGRWLVNGGLRGLVKIDLDPETTFTIAGIRLRLRQVTVSVEDPDALIAALSADSGT